MCRRWLVLTALVGASLPWCLAALVSADTRQDGKEYSGRVVSLAPLLEKDGAPLDKDAQPYFLALVCDDGRISPLLKDAGSRMFFKDPQLLNRPVVVRGRVVGKTGLLQVFQVLTLVEGKRHEPYYWCDICKIKRFEPNACDCCGAPLEFREEPIQR